jgi:general secretion pathway protein B
MSYILDALNKSEQERQQREQGISLQPLTGVPHPGNSGPRWLPIAAVALVLAAAGIFAGVYFMMRAKTPEQAVAAAPMPSAQPVPRTPNPVTVPPHPVAVRPAPVASAQAPVAVQSASTAAQAPVAARSGTSDSVKSLYQRKGMSAEEAMAQAAAESARTKAAPLNANVAGDTVKSGDAVKTFDNDEAASVQTQDVARQDMQPEAVPKSTVNEKALETELARQRADELARQREAELAARVQAEIEKMQAQDASQATRRAQAQAKVVQAKPAQAKVAPTKPAPAPVADPDADVPLATQLSNDLQKRIPNIDFGAHVYAGRTNNGFVILNGKKRYTGDTVAPGLVVQRITEDGVILDMSGTRFKLNSMSSWIN